MNAKKQEYRRTWKENKKQYDMANERKAKAPAVSLAEASRLAREMGMSYGQYMAFLRECGR